LRVIFDKINIMSVFDTFAALIVLSAAFAYINYRYIKLPASIGLMVLSLLASFLILGIGYLYPPVIDYIKVELHEFDFSEVLLGTMLSFMLFAGAIHIDIKELRQEKLSVILFSTTSVIISTFIIGSVMYFILPVFGIPANYLYCLLFGSLISPTDPIAVLGILKDAKIPKSLEMKIAGESLFNDGVAVVIFLTILQISEHPGQMEFDDILVLFVREAIGGIGLGLLIGYIGFLLMKSIDNYKVEVLITLAVVMGGYAFADVIHVSGPLAMVAAGIIIGNHGKEFAMSDITAEYVDKFWEMVDEVLNAILFVLIGLELLVVKTELSFFIIGLFAIILTLSARYLSIFMPAMLIKLKEELSQKTIIILTWGGLRGGISIALALSLKPEMQKDLWVTLTYIIVSFSILAQGLTIGKVAKKLR